MQTQMTERDKRLIVMLSIIVLVVGFGWWGIRPALKANKEMKEELEQQESEREINEMKLANLPMYEAEAASYEELIAEERVNFFPIMASNEIDRYFTDMILSKGLSSYDLTIKVGAEPVPVEPYQYSKLADQVALEAIELELGNTLSTDENSKESEDSEDSEDSESSGDGLEDPFAYTSSLAFNSEIYGVDVTLRLAGDIDKLKALIEELSTSEKKLLVRNCVWSEEISMVNDYSGYSSSDDEEEDEDDAPVALMKSTTVLNINLTMYMCDQTDNSENASADE